jgi:hypothetical protein
MPESESSPDISAVKLTPEFRPRENRETVEIPIQMDDGEVKMRVGSSGEENKELPKIRDGTIGTLTVPKSALTEDEDQKWLTKELKEIVLATTQKVWFRIKTDHRDRDKISEKARKFLGSRTPPNVGNGYRLIPISLREHLWLQHRGTKNPELKSCTCSLPDLIQEEVDTDGSALSSINQAYTRLSEIFETHRSTHTGNVYEKGFVRDLAEGDWMKLGELRHRKPEKCIWKERLWPRPWWIQEKAQTTLYGPGRRWATLDAQVQKNGKWRATPKYYSENTEGNVEKVEVEGERVLLEDVLKEFNDRGYDTYDPVQYDATPPTLPLGE